MKVVLTALNATYGHTNLAIRYLKNYCISDALIMNSMEIICKEFSINDLEFNILDELVSENAKMYAFSCYIWNIEKILEIADNIKKILPDSIIVLGGPEVSYDVDQMIYENEYIDYIVKGQGEESLRKLLLFISDESEYTLNFENVVGKTRILSFVYKNFKNCEFPYANEKINDPDKQYYYESSRGCPFSCSYCLSSVEKELVFLDEERVKNELQFFIDSKVKQVKLVDRTFNSDDKRARNIWQYLIDTYNEKIFETNFHFEISADILSINSLKLLSKAPENIFRLEIGIQSTDEGVLRNVNRKSDLTKLFLNISQIIDNKNIEVHLDLIAGLPGETYDIFKKSFNDVYSLKPDMIQLGFLKMIRGSLIRKEAHINSSIYSSYPPYEILASEDISFYELMRLKRIEFLLDKYYNSKQFTYSLEYIIKKMNKDSFYFFESFFNYFEKNFTFSKKVSRKGLITIFFEFCKIFLDEAEKKIFSDLMKFDYYRFDNKGGIENIKFNYSAGHPELDERKRKPEWFDENGRWKILKPRIEKYCFNPKKLVDEGVLQKCESFVLYDLSGNKPVIVDVITDC